MRNDEIITRLREFAAEISAEGIAEWGSAMTDAAFEIKRLRQYNDEKSERISELKQDRMVGANIVLQERIAELEARLAFYDNKCPACKTPLGLLAKSECPLCDAKAQKDAARYRWSLDNPVEYSQILFDYHHFGEDMQTAIDAAMESEK